MGRPFNEERRQVFLDSLRDTLNVSGSARAAGTSRTTIFAHRREDAEFKQAWDDALEEGLDLAEQSCNRRAFKGVKKPVFYQGERTGDWVDKDGNVTRYGDAERPAVTFIPHEVIEYSDTLAQFMLRAHRPEKFNRDRDLNLKGEITVVERILAARKRAGG